MASGAQIAHAFERGADAQRARCAEMPRGCADRAMPAARSSTSDWRNTRHDLKMFAFRAAPTPDPAPVDAVIEHDPPGDTPAQTTHPSWYRAGAGGACLAARMLTDSGTVNTPGWSVTIRSTRSSSNRLTSRRISFTRQIRRATPTRHALQPAIASMNGPEGLPAARFTSSCFRGQSPAFGPLHHRCLHVNKGKRCRLAHSDSASYGAAQRRRAAAPSAGRGRRPRQGNTAPRVTAHPHAAVEPTSKQRRNEMAETACLARAATDHDTSASSLTGRAAGSASSKIIPVATARTRSPVSVAALMPQRPPRRPREEPVALGEMGHGHESRRRGEPGTENGLGFPNRVREVRIQECREGPVPRGVARAQGKDHQLAFARHRAQHQLRRRVERPAVRAGIVAYPRRAQRTMRRPARYPHRGKIPRLLVDVRARHRNP